MNLQGSGLGRHGPIVVEAPRRSYGYAVVASPRIWGRGAPNAARCITRTGSYATSLQTCVTRKQTTTPMARGINVATAVHFALRVSFQIV